MSNEKQELVVKLAEEIQKKVMDGLNPTFDEVKTRIDAIEDAIKATPDPETLKKSFPDEGEEVRKQSYKSEVDYNKILKAETNDPDIVSFQRDADTVYILSTLAKHNRSINRFLRTYLRTAKTKLAKAMDTVTTAEGLEWIPEEFSAELQRQLRLELRVPPLFRNIPMTAKTVHIPVQLGSAIAYNKSEATSDTPSKMTASTPGTAEIQLVAKAMGARVLASTEITEDAIFDIISFIRDEIRYALRVGIEKAVLDGDSDGSHQDSDVTSSSDVRTLFDGLRKHALTNSNTVDANSFTYEKLVSGLSLMGKWGFVEDNNLALIVGARSYFKLLTMTDASGNLVFVANQNLGQTDPLLSGQVGSVAGIPVVRSEFVREDLNATGVYDGVTTDRTYALLVNRRGFILGNRRMITLEADKDIGADSIELVGTWRGDFEAVYTTDPVVVNLFNIPTT